MSLFERMKLEEREMNTFDYHQNTCFSCQYWTHKVRKDSKFCHKCINNLSLPIRKKEAKGYHLEGLRDYYKAAPLEEKEKKHSSLTENKGNS